MTGHDHEPIRRSVEVEYWVVDDAGRLTDPGELASLPGAEREFVEPLLEVKTTPCETTAALRSELFERIRGVVELAGELDRALVPLGTPLRADGIEELAAPRTRIQNRVVGDAFEYVRHCAGTHVHIEQQPGHEVDQFNALVAADPALALANSSPFFRGRRLAAGARSVLYRRLAYEDLPHQGRLWRYVDSRAEWDRRLERRYEEFRRQALAAGVDRRTLASAFDPESAVWTPVQFREAFGTVEWRSPDAVRPAQAVRLADDLAGLVRRVRESGVRIEGERGRATDDGVVLPEFGPLLDYLEDAIETGLTGGVRAYLDRLGFAVDAYESHTERFDAASLTEEAARQCRLDAADRLVRDVRRAPAGVD